MRCLKPILVKNPKTEQYVYAPCGNCYACLSNRRAEWSLRCSIETNYAKSSFFVTLTYAPGYEDGNVNKRDVQLFIKRLRRSLPGINLRYFIASEYGCRTDRPHYHGLFWLDHDLSFHDFSVKCENAWHNGFIYVGDVTPADIHYTTSYCITKDEVVDGLCPNFYLMSRNPGIGYQLIKSRVFVPGKNGYRKKFVLDSYKLDSFNTDNCYLAQDGFKYAMPRFYRDNIYSDIEKKTIKQKKEFRDLKNPPLKPAINILADEQAFEHFEKEKKRHFTKKNKI